MSADATTRKLRRADKKARAALARLRAAVTLLGKARLELPDGAVALHAELLTAQAGVRVWDKAVLKALVRLSEVTP